MKMHKEKNLFLEPIDFASLYKKHKQESVFKGKSSESWDKRSGEMAPRMQKSAYVDEFISKMDIDGDEVVLDIGCGPGTLAVPLAKRVKKIIAIDFSRAMLDELEKYAKNEGVSNIETHHLAWDDEWDKLLEDVDIIVASRSIEVKDISEALAKMSKKAKKACYVTYKVGGSFVDQEILDFIEKKIVTKPDFWYIPLILYKDGYLPKIDYIYTNDGSVRHNSKEEFVNTLVWSLGGLDERQHELSCKFYDDFVVCEKYTKKPTVWAFISWSSC